MATLEQMYTPQAFSPQTTLSQDIGASDTRIYVASVNVFPTPPTLATIGIDAASAETVKITAKGTNYIDVQRGLLGTAKSWTTNSVIARNFSAADQTAIQNNINVLNATKLESVEADDVVNNTLTNDKLAKVATNTLKGRRSANQGNVEDLTVAQVLSMLNVSSGADKTTAILEALLAIASYDETVRLVVLDPTQAVGRQVKYLTIATLVSRLNDIYAAKSTTINSKSLANNITLTAADVGAEATGTASSAVSSHNSASGAHKALFDKKQDAPLSSSSFPTSGTALAANTIYTVSGVRTYAFTAPTTGNKWAHGKFTTGSTVNVSFNGTFQGAAPSIEANKTYEFDVFDSVWAVQEVVSA